MSRPPTRAARMGVFRCERTEVEPPTGTDEGAAADSRAIPARVSPSALSWAVVVDRNA